MIAGKPLADGAAAAFLAIVFIACGTVAAGTQHERNSLKGLRELKVIVEEIEPQAESWRVSAKRLQALLEREIQKAGMALAAPDLPLLGNPFLYLNVNLLEVAGSHGIYAANVTLVLRQYVFLERDPNIGTYGETWRRSTLIVTPVERLEEIEHVVARDVAEFIGDYQAVQQP